MKMRLVVRFDMLPQRLMLNPNSRWIGLHYDKARSVLHAVYLAKEDDEERMPWRGLITMGPWDMSDEGEEYFLEALTADNLLQRLGRFIHPEHFCFFEVPASMGMDVISNYPDRMLSILFPELGEPLTAGFQLTARKLLNSMHMKIKS